MHVRITLKPILFFDYTTLALSASVLGPLCCGRGGYCAHVETGTWLFLAVITVYLYVKIQIRKLNVSDNHSLTFLP